MPAQMISLMICLMPCAGFDHSAIGRPEAAPHVGHASNPCSARTRLATAICCSREAAAGLPTPPNAAQVAGLNCSPPYLPFPVLAAQLPPDSHCATASQFGLGPAWATAVESDMDAVTSPAAMADLMSGLAILVMLDISPEVAEALPIRESGEIGCLLHRDRPWSAGKGCTTGLIRPAVGPGNTTVLLSSGPVDRGYRGGGTALCRVWRGRVGRRRTARTANSSDSKSATASDYSGSRSPIAMPIDPAAPGGALAGLSFQSENRLYSIASVARIWSSKTRVT